MKSKVGSMLAGAVVALAISVWALAGAPGAVATQGDPVLAGA